MIHTREAKTPAAQHFLWQLENNWLINRDFYDLMPENKFDYRMVDNTTKKSDSPRDHLAHQITVIYDYANGIRQGTITFHDNTHYDQLKKYKKMTKADLIHEYDQAMQTIVDLLAEEDIDNKQIKVSWYDKPILALSALSGLNAHEILHTGINLTLMDVFNMKRYKSLIGMWGE